VKISEVMTRDIEFIHESDTIAETARKMKELNVGIMPVFDENRLAGVITDRDITIRGVAQGLDPQSTRVGQIMTKDVVSCVEDDDASEAVKTMQINKIRRLIVRDDQNKVVGIVSLGDLAVNLNECLVGEALRDVSEPARPFR
jgi:CBS domain-containing protein